MANLFDAKPFIIDTVMAASWRNQPNILGLAPLYPKWVYWLNPVTLGDTFTILDTVRNMVVLEGRCENANQSQVFPTPGAVWADFQVTVLGSGKLEIFY